MSFHYAFKEYVKESNARAYSSLPISLKTSVEICNFLKNKKVQKAKKILEDVQEMKIAVPYRRYVHDIPHKPGIGPGRYPIKACEYILKLLSSAEANAQSKGLNTSNLIVRHISAKKGNTAWHYGRKRSRRMKRCYIEIVLSEAK
nr:50S ribosomal protein L22P [uncultured archaeon]